MSESKQISDVVIAEGILYDEADNGGLLLAGDIRLRDLVFIFRDNNLEIGVKAAGGAAVTDVASFDALAQRLTIGGWEDGDQPVKSLLLEDGTAIDLPRWVADYDLAGSAPVELSSVMMEDSAPLGSEVVKGSGGDESLSAVPAGAQYVYGGGGNDVLYGGLDGDALHGGADEDTVSYSYADERVWVNLQMGTVRSVSAVDTISGIENAEGSAYGDTLTGDGGENKLLGLGGDDVLYGGGGNDELHGGGGNDVYWLGVDSGRDTIYESAVSGDTADVLKIQSGIAASDVRIRGSADGSDLIVELMDGGVVTDSVTVKGFYVNAGARIERVEIEGGGEGSVWDEVDLDAALSGMPVITDTSGRPDGTINNDVYDSRGGNTGRNFLEGGLGDDTYWLGRGSGDGVIRELEGGGNDVIRIKSGVDMRDVRIRRSNTGWHYYVELLDVSTRGELDSRRRVTDSFEVQGAYSGGSRSDVGVERVEFSDGTVWEWSEFAHTLEITGGSGGDTLIGRSGRDGYPAGNTDIFDSDAGGDDILLGRSGDDVYWLGRKTGRDTIQEYYRNSDGGDDGDVIKIKQGIEVSNVRLIRSGAHLLVELLDSGVVTDSLTVENYYSDENARIERIELTGLGTVWNSDDIARLVQMNGPGNDTVVGSDDDDVFDSNAGGNDTLQGRGGNDVYWLGDDTDHDIIEESAVSGDRADVIKIKSGIIANKVHVRSSSDRNDLIVEITNDGEVTDSLTVKNFYVDAGARVERVESADGTVLWDEVALDVARTGRTLMTEEDGGVEESRVYGTDGEDVYDRNIKNFYWNGLFGSSGDDTYWLGRGSGYSSIGEGEDGGNDVIRIKSDVDMRDVRIRPSNDGFDYFVELLDASTRDEIDSRRPVTDMFAISRYDNLHIERVEFSDGTVWNLSEFLATLEITGDRGDENLFGYYDNADIFDSDAGGNDALFGRGGNDVYWLGRGTGRDTIWEHSGDGDSGDVIKIKFGIDVSDVRLRRFWNYLLVELVDENNAVTDSLTVIDHYSDEKAKVEYIEFADGTVWELEGIGSDNTDDVFDNVAGDSDLLQGRGGNDIYRLGDDTGRDTIEESAISGDRADVIKIKSGISADRVHVRGSEDGNDLIVEITNGNTMTDFLTVKNFYVDAGARVERVELFDGTVLWDEVDLDIAAAGRTLITAGAGTSGNDVYDSNNNRSDSLEGGLGDDTYWLGRGTGNDVIREWVGDSGGNDVIRIKSDVDMRDVRIRRSDDGHHYLVELLDAGTRGELDSRRRVTDMFEVNAAYRGGDYSDAVVERVEFSDGTVWRWSRFARTLEITGDSGNDTLTAYGGLAGDKDIFDSDAGGNDILQGRGGGDVYWLGSGTDHDTIQEYVGNNSTGAGDVIKIKVGIVVSNVRLTQSAGHLLVELLNDSGLLVTDKLTVENYYSDEKAKIERIEFSDNRTIWRENDIARIVVIKDGPGSDTLIGSNVVDDELDGSAGGNDILQGRGGDDVYLLGDDTGHDTIQELIGNSGTGDAGDVIKIKEGIAVSNVRLTQLGENLLVELLNGSGSVTDKLTVENYYSDEKARIERIEFSGDTTVWDEDTIAQTAVIRDGPGVDTLTGLNYKDDILDGSAGGNDILQGRGGDDVYLLGDDTGHDTIQEFIGNSGTGDAGDVIKIKEGIAPSDVRLRRSGDHLLVELVDQSGVVTDLLKVENHYSDEKARIERVEFSGDITVWDEDYIAQYEAIRGKKGDETLDGFDDTDDVFDSAAGGNDVLQGRGGDDVYWLGRGTERDTIQEYVGNSGRSDTGDVIKIKHDIEVNDVWLRRSGDDLFVELVDETGAVTDSLKVENYYNDEKAKIEYIEFANGLIWDADDIIEQAAAIRGGAGNDTLNGLDNKDDVFDSVAGGNDLLQGRSGDDVYWLGRGTGRDTIREHYDNSGTGDAGDVIKIKFGIAARDLRLRRLGEHLLVELVDETGAVTDSLTVENHYSDDKTAKVEYIEFADGGVWGLDGIGLDNQDDIFDNAAGKNDILRGRGGNDIYWLGDGTGRDTIEESAISGDMADVIKIKSGIRADNVRVRSSSDGNDLIVEITNDDVVTNSLTVKNFYTGAAGTRIERVEDSDGAVLWDEVALDAARAGRTLVTDGSGTDGDDVYDSNDNRPGSLGSSLFGGLGDDTYWLGRGTGNDRVRDYGGDNDVIRIKSDVDVRDVRIRLDNDGKHYFVELLDASTRDELDSRRRVTDGIRVLFGNFYRDGAIARVEFSDGTVWNWSEFKSTLEITGGSGNDTLTGHNTDREQPTGADIFDSDAGGSDTLRGRGGDDVYWLGRGTDGDTIQEYHDNSGDGDAGDVIKIKSGIEVSDVRLQRLGNDLYVQFGSTDSLRVERHFSEDRAKIERIEADGQVLLESQFQNLINDLATFREGDSSFETEAEIYDHYWDDNMITTPGG